MTTPGTHRRPRTLSRALSTLALAGLAATTLPGCTFLVGKIATSAKKTTVNLDKYEVQTMRVGLRQEEKMICPGKPVQMAVFAEAIHAKRKKKKVKQLQTWSGDPSKSRIGKLGFERFTFSSDQGLVDENGYYQPSGDILGTVDGFSITTALNSDPTKFTVVSDYKPAYSCITGTGGAGMSGAAGSQGSSGSSGSNGSGGSSEKAGGDGSGGGGAGNGTDGGDGGVGPTLVAYATMVKTPHYDALGIIRVTGDREDTILFDPKTNVVVSAMGGSGGPGGSGGTGGSGGSGGSGYQGGAGGSGGPGGVGANGGNGGPGGSLTLIYDDKWPELANVIVVDASGGAAGSSGFAGRGGSGGSKGGPMGEGGVAGTPGADGADGIAGQPGQPGPAGTAVAQAGNVDAFFGDLPANIERL